jgi:hypothetical protein
MIFLFMRRGYCSDLGTWSNNEFGFIVRSVVAFLAAQTAILSVLIGTQARMEFHITLSSLGIFTRTIAE